ncbi:MAG: hypothetical protein MUF64_06270 [Polyangiaceae bacterium]|nr:hypothetical protein [Polyangiaceae bacterium]
MALPKLDRSLWLERYSQARQQMLQGKFPEVAPTLESLARQTDDPSQGAVATELGWLARSWTQQGLKLQPPGHAATAPRVGDRKYRTIDELSVLYTSSVFYGLGTGVWLATVTEPESIAGIVLPSLALAGASAGAVALLDRGEGLRYGVPQSIVTGMTLGLQEGLVWSLWNQARVRSDEEWEPSTVATVIWGFSTAGAVAGGLLGTYGGTTPGRASYVGSTGLWGGLLAGLVTRALTEDDTSRDDKSLLAGAIGLNAGAVLGALTATRVSPSIARVRFLDLGGLSGGLLFGGVYFSVRGADSTREGALGATALGIASGLGVAWFATGGMAPDRPEESASKGPASWVSNIHFGVQPSAQGATLALSGALW